MKIEKLEIDHINGNYITVQQRLNQVIEALNSITVEKIREPEGKQVSYPRDEKREKMAQDANYKNMPEYGEFWRNVKRSSIEEPKSTLREATLKIVRTVADLQAEPVADKIISLFKDTLLKEIDKLISIDGGYGYDRREIEQIIQNL